MNVRWKPLACLAFAAFPLILGVDGKEPAAPSLKKDVTVRVFSLPSKRANSPEQIANYKVVERFRELYPHIHLKSATALSIEGKGMDAAPLMSIAGGTSPDIIFVNFRQSETYISQGFLHPLDEYLAQMSAEEQAECIPGPVLPVICREGPGGKHYWAMPQQVVAMVLMYRRDLFAAAGLNPDQPPKTWEELREFARRVSDPSKGIYGLAFPSSSSASWGMYSYLCSAGARAVRQLPNGEWRACFDSEEAVTAYEFVRELQKEVVTRNGKTGNIAYHGNVGSVWADGKLAMTFGYLGSGQLGNFNTELIGVGPIPTSPSGKSSAEINCLMLGIFAGQKDKRVRDAAWEYIRFLNSTEARRVFTETMAAQGAARLLSPKWLRQFGFADLARLSPPGLEEAFERSLTRGTPEPYGKNCQFIYRMMTIPMDQLYFADFQDLTREQIRVRIKECLTRAVQETNEKMLGMVPEPVRKKRNVVAWTIIGVAVIGFSLLVRQVFGWISLGRSTVGEKVSQHKTRLAILLIAPALILILVWSYFPLLCGSLIAFQDYRLMGGSSWVGISNFADVIFDSVFWLSLKNAFYFCLLWMVMGFFPPLLLALMLQEISVGKLFYRILYFLPSVVSGVVILFMWRAIYDPSDAGILNKILAFVHIPPQKWLQDPRAAMFCVVLPLAWASLGPSCIIYLAALKGVPDELYEAADIDGASFWNKLFYIVLPYMKPLLVINGVGAVIFGFKSGDAILAMTGGGPNMATHVVGYEIFERTFLFLQFAHGTAMAWILGMLLLAFTAYQLKILNKVEFRTANR